MPTLVRIALVLLLAVVVAVVAALRFFSAQSGFGLSEWVLGGAATPGPEFLRIDLELDLRRPPELRGVATLRGRSAEGAAGDVEFLLNRELDIDRVVEDGVERAWKSGPKLRSSYHQEARVVRVARPARSGEWSLTVEYSGRGMTGKEGRDWMGILLMAPDELRMSVQTVFYPQVEPDPDGPGVAPLAASVRVLAPAGFEVYVPGRRVDAGPAVEGGTAWRFESDQPTVLSLFAAPRVRRETELGDARVVTLLRDEHAHLGEAFAAEARKILDAYGRMWGPIGPRTLGVCEIDCRGNSYNWAAQGIITLDKRAFDRTVPVEKLAHEIAHLWWGQEVVATGRGERFLTESFAEYAAWRYLAEAHGAARARREIDTARASWLSQVHEQRTDPALADVTFSTPGYDELAYAKGPLALLALERRIGSTAMDALLRKHRAAAKTGAVLEAFLAAVREHGEPARIVPWIESPGHAHLGWGEVSAVDGVVRGLVVAARCPGACPELVPTVLEIGARWPDRSSTLELEMRSASASFTSDWTSIPPLLELDPRGLVLGERPEAQYRGPAEVVASEPSDGAEGVALGPLTVRITFAAPVTASAAPSVEAVERIQGACNAEALASNTAFLSVRSVRLADDGRTLHVGVERTAPGTRYTFVVPDGVLESDGLPLPGLRLAFSTGAGDPASRPRIVSTEPAHGARDVPCDLGRIRVVFSEPMQTQVGFKTPRVKDLERKGRHYPSLGEARWEDEHTLVWELESPLEAGRGYGLPFGERYLDLEGHELVGFDLTFTTARP